MSSLEEGRVGNHSLFYEGPGDRYYVGHFAPMPSTYREVKEHGLPQFVVASGSLAACAAARRLLSGEARRLGESR
ncbi:MAG: hypothetical protein Q8L48_16650 [Archangium sp.]|nr:hypothetical protein [Archangium sp.]